MADNRPRRREKNVTGQGEHVGRRGEGLGQGPVGNKSGYSGRSGSGSHQNRGSGDGGGTRDSSGLISGILGSLLNGSGGKSKIIIIVVVIVLIIALIFGGKNLLSGLFGGGGTVTGTGLTNFTSSSVSTGWTRSANTGTLDKSVAKGAGEKRTVIKGDGTDKVTIMVYMCGTDLESKNGMASRDLAEMCSATLSDNVEILVLTGGCTGWKTKGISNSTNQIYRVASGKIELLEKDAGNNSMTTPSTLTKFITWCAKKYPANRNILIFWDHGGGSLSGYGYDQRFTSSGSMSLAGIDTALKNADVSFDFIGFDACLMATTENALMLSKYADYLIASEETEPGAGWYYTGWLTQLAKYPGMATIEIGKLIVDDFTDYCAEYVQGAKTTLSVVDLCELKATLPEGIRSFAEKTVSMIESDDYATVSDARAATREFSVKNKIDQVDLVDLAGRMNTKEGEALAKIVLSAVKYNRTSSDMTNSYGLSIYFPYRQVGKVDTAVKAYDAIGMDDDYTKCIKSFAQLETAGQVASGGSSSTSPLTSILGNLGSVSVPSSSGSSGISSILTSFLGGSSGIDIGGIASTGLSFLSGMDVGKAANYINENHLEPKDFEFKRINGKSVIELPDEKWALVQDIELNVFLDDGEGYIDLGTDAWYDLTDNGQLLGEYDRTWPAINGRPVAFYHERTVDDGTNYSITCRIPILYNGERADIIVIYSNVNPKGIIAGVSYDYAENVTETAAKMIDEIEDGAEIKFLCDYYTYGNVYQDSYVFGDPLTVSGPLTLSDVIVSGSTSAVYRITDIYGQVFWSSVMDEV